MDTSVCSDAVRLAESGEHVTGMRWAVIALRHYTASPESFRIECGARIKRGICQRVAFAQ